MFILTLMLMAAAVTFGLSIVTGIWSILLSYFGGWRSYIFWMDLSGDLMFLTFLLTTGALVLGLFVAGA